MVLGARDDQSGQGRKQEIRYGNRVVGQPELMACTAFVYGCQKRRPAAHLHPRAVFAVVVVPHGGSPEFDEDLPGVVRVVQTPVDRATSRRHESASVVATVSRASTSRSVNASMASMIMS
jgi:hypothetical protein